MNSLDETLAKGEAIAAAAVLASKTENIAQITDLLVDLASISGTINVELFKAQTKEKRAKAEYEDILAKTRFEDIKEGGSGVHADAKALAHSIPSKKAHRIAEENYRYIKTFRDNYQVIIEVLRSRVSALKTEQKNL
jgi:hypothetical protein